MLPRSSITGVLQTPPAVFNTDLVLVPPRNHSCWWALRPAGGKVALFKSSSVHQQDVFICCGSVTTAEEGAWRRLQTPELPRVGRVRALCNEGVQVGDVDGLLGLVLDGLVGSRDEGDEQGQHHVDEEGDEGVQVHLAEQPHQRAGLLHLGERHKHVVTVDE